MHEVGAAGVSPDGGWSSGFLDVCADAFANYMARDYDSFLKIKHFK